MSNIFDCPRTIHITKHSKKSFQVHVGSLSRGDTSEESFCFTNIQDLIAFLTRQAASFETEAQQ